VNRAAGKISGAVNRSGGASFFPATGAVARVLVLAAALAWAGACSGARSDQERVEAELARARAGLGAGTAAEPSSLARATGTQRLETILPATPLRGAGGLACRDGQVYVAEPLVDRVSAIQATGSVTRIGTPHGFVRPVDLAFDDAGVMYVATADVGGAWRREPAGQWSRIATELSDLGGIALSPSGEVILSECARGGRLLRANPTGGAATSIATGLGCPGRIHVEDDGTILVPLRESGQVVAIDPATKAKTVLATGLDIPSAVARTPDGGRVVLEAGTGWIRSLPGGAGTADASLARVDPGVADLVVCGETVVVSNEATGALHAFKPWPTSSRLLAPNGLVVASGLIFSGEDLIVADRASIKRIRNGELELLVPSRFDGMPPPVGLAGGLPGIVWITSPERGELFQVDLGRGETSRILSGLDWPTSILRTLVGDLVVAETGAGRVVKIGLGAVPYTITSGLMSPVALATRGERILAAEPIGGRVLRLRQDEAPTILAGGLAAPAGLATAQGRPLYIAEERKGAVLVRSRDGTIRRVIEGLALRTTREKHALPVPLAIGPDGSVVVASPQDGSVVRLWPY